MKLNEYFIRAFLPITLAVASPWVSAQSMGPTLDHIAQTGIVYMAHRESAVPFSYLVPGRDEPEGYSIEICGHVIKAIEDKLGKKLQRVPMVASANSRVMMVKAGMANLECGITTNTVARAQQVAFSKTIFTAEVKVMVAADSGIKTLNDLADKRLVTTAGATAERMVKQVAMTRKMTVRSLIGGSNLASMRMLEQNQVDAYVGEDAVLAGMRAQSASPEKYVILEESYSAEPYGIVLPKEDPQFKALVDETLIGLMKSGQMEKIYNSWFLSPIPPNNQVLNLPLSPLNKATFANPSERSIN